MSVDPIERAAREAFENRKREAVKAEPVTFGWFLRGYMAGYEQAKREADSWPEGPDVL